MKNNKQDIYGCNPNATCTNIDFWNKTKPKYHTYILQYCLVGDRGIREFLDEYIKKNCVLLVTCGISGGGGCTFATESDICFFTLIIKKVWNNKWCACYINHSRGDSYCRYLQSYVDTSESKVKHKLFKWVQEHQNEFKLII